MKGWQFTGTGEPLKLVEQETPKAKEGYVVIKVANCGLCHSDVGALDDPGWVGNIIKKVPVIMGHEASGVITEVGPGVEGWKVGDRVAVCPMYTADDAGPGYGRDGGYANYTTAPQEMLVKVPDNVDLAQAAASTDAGMTSYHAVVQVGGVKKGTKVGIIGIGGLGTVGARVAIGLGAEVYAASRSENARRKIEADGAYKTAVSIAEFKDDNLDVIIDFAGFGKTLSDAVATVGFKGKVVVVGMGALEFPLNTSTLITRQLKVVGSNGGTQEDIANVLDLISKGDLTIDIQLIDFDEVPEKIDVLRERSVEKRFVMETKEKDYQ